MDEARRAPESGWNHFDRRANFCAAGIGRSLDPGRSLSASGSRSYPAAGSRQRAAAGYRRPATRARLTAPRCCGHTFCECSRTVWARDRRNPRRTWSRSTRAARRGPPPPRRIRRSMDTSERDRLRQMLLDRSMRFGDFVLSSGAHSNYYIDVRKTSLHPEGLRWISKLFFEALKADNVTAIGGLTLGADPLAPRTTESAARSRATSPGTSGSRSWTTSSRAARARSSPPPRPNRTRRRWSASWRSSTAARARCRSSSSGAIHSRPCSRPATCCPCSAAEPPAA